MTMTKEAPRKVAAAEKKAAILARRGEGATFAQIASEFSLSVRRVRAIVAEQFTLLLRDNNTLAEELVKVQNGRLNELLEAVWDEALEGEVKAVASALAIIDRQCRLHGIDAPSKTEGKNLTLTMLGDLDTQARRLGISLDLLRGPNPSHTSALPALTEVVFDVEGEVTDEPEQGADQGLPRAG